MPTTTTSEPRTMTAGLLGEHIGYSLSPAIHVAEARHHGIELTFELLDTEVLDATPEEVLDRVAACGYAGVNVTQPYKERLIGMVASLEDAAELAGSINGIVFDPGGWHGFNADAHGFGAELDYGLGDVDFRDVVQFGSGGAGVSTAIALLRRGTHRLTLVDLDAARAQALAERLSTAFPLQDVRACALDRLPRDLRDVTGIVNASTQGSESRPGSPLPPDITAPSNFWVADVVYAPAETELLRWGRAHGAATVNGERMLVHQAARTFEALFGVAPDVDRMWRHFQSMRDGA